MSMSFHYVPILKWKRGEQQALAQLFPADKNHARPLIELLPESLDDDDSSSPNQKDPYAKAVDQLLKSWGTTSAIFVDFGLLDPSTTVANGQHPVHHFADLARGADLRIIPVTGVYRDPSFQSAVATAAASDQLGVCVRITPEEFAEQTFPSDLQAALVALQQPPSSVDIVIDYGYIRPTQQASTAVAALGAISSLPSVSAWRTVTFAASSFPENLASVGVGTDTIYRAEWDAWNRLQSRTSAIRHVLFGDYTATHPIYVSLPYPGAASIRYTITDSWLILRGRKVTGPVHGGFGQFVTLAQQLVADQRYCGSSFSWGDKYIEQCASGAAKTGNLTTWRAIATNHHITFVVRQIAGAILGAPSTATAQ